MIFVSAIEFCCCNNLNVFNLISLTETINYVAETNIVAMILPYIQENLLL